jgi:hypothetical protein
MFHTTQPKQMNNEHAINLSWSPLVRCVDSIENFAGRDYSGGFS